MGDSEVTEAARGPDALECPFCPRLFVILPSRHVMHLGLPCVEYMTMHVDDYVRAACDALRVENEALRREILRRGRGDA